MKKELATLLCLSTISLTPVFADWNDVWSDLQSAAKKTSENIKETWNAQARRLDKIWGDADEDSALVGRFYDLKQPIKREAPEKPECDGETRKNMRQQEPGETAKPLHGSEVTAFIGEFVKSGWDSAMLERYYSPDVELYAPYFYLPRCKASYGPHAFDCADSVKPTAWVAHYRGVVTAPKSGRFRFVGTADDTILVRFNKKLVLESGWSIPTKSSDMNHGTRREYQDEITRRYRTPAALYQYATTPHWNCMLGGIASGEAFNVKAGERYPIEILVSEIPGSEFGFCLLVEELPKWPSDDKSGRVAPEESPTLWLFRTNDSFPSKESIESILQSGDEDYRIENMECPPFLADSPIWHVKSDKKPKEEKYGFLKRVNRVLNNDDTAMGVRKHVEESEE